MKKLICSFFGVLVISGGAAMARDLTCPSGVGSSQTTYRCMAGYYLPTSSATQCRSCKTDTENSAATSTDENQNNITGCYVSTFSDIKGSGKYKTNCYYKS